MSTNIEKQHGGGRNPLYLITGYGIAGVASCFALHFLVFADEPIFDRVGQGSLAVFWTLVAAAHNHYEANLHKN